MQAFVINVIVQVIYWLKENRKEKNFLQFLILILEWLNNDTENVYGFWSFAHCLCYWFVMQAKFLLNLNGKIRQICSGTVGVTEISDIFAAYNKCSFQYAGRVMSTREEKVINHARVQD